MQTRSYIRAAAFLLLSALPLSYLSAIELKTSAARFLFNITADQNGQLVLPSDIASYKKRLYVVDGGQHRVVVFNQQGKFLFSFGKAGNKKAEFNYPVGIDVAVNGDVYVADSGNRRIQVFSAKGKYKRSFKTRSGRYLIRPIDVLVDEKQKRLMVTGNENHKVMVFSLTGKLKKSWGDHGVGEAEFRYPATLAHLKDGRVAVVDVLNSRVQVFEKNGKYNSQVSGWGVTAGQVFRPKGIAVSSNGNIYVSDSYLNAVQVFSDEGDFLHLLDTGDQHELFTPVGITVDANNRLYITEMRRNRISVFQLSR